MGGERERERGEDGERAELKRGEGEGKRGENKRVQGKER